MMFALKNMQRIASRCISRVWTIQESPLRRRIDHRICDYRSSSSFTEKHSDSNASLAVLEGKMEYCDVNDGMRLIVEFKESFVTTIGCLLPAGAAFEKFKERGSALFLEHVLFQRTTQRTDRRQIEMELQEIGGILTVRAMRDMFVFYGIAPSCNACRLADLIVDVAVNSVICDNDVESAKCRILTELFKVDPNSEQVAMDYLVNIAYQDTPLSKSVFPESHVIRNFETKYLESFRDRVFKPYFMTMISTGAITLNELQEVMCKYITESAQVMPYSACNCKLKSLSGLKQLRFSGGDLRFRDDDEKLGHVAIGLEGPTFSQCADRYAFEVAKEIVGSWDMTYGGANHNAPYLAHSAFNTGICHLYKSFILDYACNSIWGCYFVCDKMKLDDMVSMLLSEWIKLSTTVRDTEVQRAVNTCKFHELTKMNDPVSRFLDIVNSLYLRNRYEPLKKRLTGFEKVTVDTIRDVASRYIYDQSPAVVGLGRIENLTDYRAIQHGTYSFYY